MDSSFPYNRHTRTFDLSAITNPVHKHVVQEALNACRYPFGRIRKRVGKDKKVPVLVSDLSRYAEKLNPKAGQHAHVHDADGREGHLLGDKARNTVLGLFWLPTPREPAGKIEIHKGIMGNVPLAQEVFLAETAHAVDFGVPLTAQQKKDIFTAYHNGDPNAHGGHGWFDEKGSKDYWSWVGESFMGGFMAAFAPKLPRPLEKHQPWTHPTTPAVVTAIRKALR